MIDIDINEDDIEEIKVYFKMREQQMDGQYLITSSYQPIEEDGEVWGIRVIFRSTTTGAAYQSVFVLESHRGKGLMQKYAAKLVEEHKMPFITAAECDIVDWFVKHKVPILVVPLKTC